MKTRRTGVPGGFAFSERNWLASMLRVLASEAVLASVAVLTTSPVLPLVVSGKTGEVVKTATDANTASDANTRSIDANQFLSLNANPPGTPVRLVFIHHSVGEDWLDDSKGGLAKALKDNNYFVSDTNYGWGPP